MNFKRNAILLGLAAALVLWMLVYSMTRPDNEPDEGSVLFQGLAGLKAGDFDSVEIIRSQPKQEKLVFTRGENKQWSCISPTQAVVNQAEIDEIVNTFVRLKLVTTPDTKQSPQLLGLESPTVTITAKQGTNRSATLHIGNTTIGGDRAITFIATPSFPNSSLAVKKSDLSAIWKDDKQGDGEAWNNLKLLSDLRAKRLLGADLRDPHMETKSLRLKTGGKELHIQAETNGNWRFLAPANYGDVDAGGDIEINKEFFTGARPLLNYLSTVQIQSGNDIIESPAKEQIEKFGLKYGDPATMQIELTNKSGITETLFVGKSVEGKANHRYARREGDSCIFQVIVDRYDLLLRTIGNPVEMRNRDILPMGIFAQIDAVDVTVGETTTKLRKYGSGEINKWFLAGGANDPKDAHYPPLDQLLKTLTSPRLAKDFPAKADSAYAPSEIAAVIKIWRNSLGSPPLPQPGKPTPEPIVNGEPIVITISKKNESGLVHLKKVEGQITTEFKVPDTVAKMAEKQRLDFVAANLVNIPSNKVMKMTIDKADSSVVVSKSTKSDPLYPQGRWNFLKPDAMKDQNADQPNSDGLIGTVLTTVPQKVVSESPNENDLKRFGFLPKPLVKISLELIDEPSNIRSYELGSETEDHQFVYARQSGNPHIYTIPKEVSNRIMAADLRDAFLYRFDPAKLTSVTIKGWATSIPVPPPHEYVKKENGWVCASPADKVMDPKKFANLVGTIMSPRALRFLGPITPDHKLDPSKGAIEITMKFEGDSKPITLTIGAEIDNNLNYAVSVSTKPNEAFAVQAAALRVLAGSPNGVLVDKPVVPAPTPMAPAPTNSAPMNSVPTNPMPTNPKPPGN